MPKSCLCVYMRLVLTLIPTSIGYRAAEHAANPADVMLPCIITSLWGTIAAFILVGIKQRVNF